MFASPNIMFFSFIRRLTHSIFQFGLAFFFPVGLWPKQHNTGDICPDSMRSEASTQHSGEMGPVFSAFSLPLGSLP